MVRVGCACRGAPKERRSRNELWIANAFSQERVLDVVHLHGQRARRHTNFRGHSRRRSSAFAFSTVAGYGADLAIPGSRLLPVSVITTSYGRAALDALRTVVADAKVKDAMAAVTILVPNNTAGIVARRYLALGLLGDGRPGVAGLHLSTLPRLAEQLAAPSLAPRTPATRPIVAAAWRRALSNDPGAFRSIATHPATVRGLAQAHRELREELAYWEGDERFFSIVRILRQRYGRLLQEVRPTPGSELYLYGDSLRARGRVQELNHELAAGDPGSGN